MPNLLNLRPHDIPAEGRPVQPPDERIHTFAEIKGTFSPVDAQQQGLRCHHCQAPTCGVGCPLNRDIPHINDAIGRGDRGEAFERLNEGLASSFMAAFALVTEAICPQGKLCESTCVQEVTGHGSVTIGDNLLTVAREGKEDGKILPPNPMGEERNTKIAIVGSGPGGLAAAWALREQGFQVDIFEAQDKAGGQLEYGIPGFKLDKKYPEFLVSHLEAAGVKFKLNTQIVGSNPENESGKVLFDDLRRDYHEVVLATGLYEPRPLDVPGADLPQVQLAFDYLKVNTQQNILGTNPEDFATGALNAKGKHVVVLGGGDTAMDVVRTAIRQGAASVTLAYRGDEAQIPAYIKERMAAIEEKVNFTYNVTQTEIRPATDGKGVEILFDQKDKGSKIILSADLVIPAFGFSIRSLGIDVIGNGRIKHQPRYDPRQINYLTTTDNVWAIGDIVHGNSLAVHAIRDGRDVGEQIAAQYPVLSNEPRNTIMARLAAFNRQAATPINIYN